jgi:hypothetical protein
MEPKEHYPTPDDQGAVFDVEDTDDADNEEDSEEEDSSGMQEMSMGFPDHEGHDFSWVSALLERHGYAHQNDDAEFAPQRQPDSSSINTHPEDTTSAIVETKTSILSVLCLPGETEDTTDHYERNPLSLSSDARAIDRKQTSSGHRRQQEPPPSHGNRLSEDDRAFLQDLTERHHARDKEHWKERCHAVMSDNKHLANLVHSLQKQVKLLQERVDQSQHQLTHGRCYTTTPVHPNMWVWYDTRNMRTIPDHELEYESTKHHSIREMASNIHARLQSELQQRRQSQQRFQNKLLY